MDEIADFMFGFGIDTLGQFSHLIDIHIRDIGGEYVPTSVTLPFSNTGHVHGGWVPHIDNFDGSAAIVSVPRDLQVDTMQRVFAKGSMVRRISHDMSSYLSLGKRNGRSTCGWAESCFSVAYPSPVGQIGRSACCSTCT